MRSDYIPNREADLVTWSQNISTMVVAAPASYGVAQNAAADMSSLVSDFVNAYAMSQSPTSRTPQIVKSKNLAKKAMISAVRSVVRTIQGCPTVSPDSKVALGINPRDTKPSPIPAPSTAPLIEVVSVNGRTAILNLKNTENPSRNGKPAGVIGASVFSYVGATAPTEASQWSFVGNTSKTVKLEVRFPANTPSGATVWFSAFWFNQRKESGPAASATSTNLPGGAVDAQQQVLKMAA